MEGKVRRARGLLDEGGLATELEVDGGITARTAPGAVRAGARVLVAGSAVYGLAEPPRVALTKVRESVGGIAKR
jgi:ribulose-phosphate 3-epimerase